MAKKLILKVKKKSALQSRALEHIPNSKTDDGVPENRAFSVGIIQGFFLSIVLYILIVILNLFMPLILAIIIILGIIVVVVVKEFRRNRSVAVAMLVALVVLLLLFGSCFSSLNGI